MVLEIVPFHCAVILLDAKEAEELVVGTIADSQRVAKIRVLERRRALHASFGNRRRHTLVEAGRKAQLFLGAALGIATTIDIANACGKVTEAVAVKLITLLVVSNAGARADAAWRFEEWREGLVCGGKGCEQQRRGAVK